MLTFSCRRRRVPNANIFLRQKVIKSCADRFYGVGKKAIQSQDDFMIVPVAYDGLRQRHCIAANTAKTAFGLRGLHIDNDAHQLFSF